METSQAADACRLEYLFDLQNKQIVVGQYAVKNYLQNKPGSDLANLPALLVEGLSPDYPKRQHYKKERGSKRWTKEECIEKGKFLVALLDEEEVELDLNILDVASQLGLIASSSHLRSRWLFGSIDNFYQAIDLNKLRKPGRFASWSRQDFVDYINQIAVELDGKPTKKDIWELIRSGLVGPSPRIIKNRFGTFSKALEFAGFPNIPTWEKEDYINWGVQYMKANSGLTPTCRLIDYLSRLRRGPSATTVAKYFGSLRSYQAAIRPAYSKDQRESEAERAKKLSQIETDKESGNLPSVIFTVSDSEDELLTRVAKYRVVAELLPKLEPKTKLFIASRSLVNENGRGFVDLLMGAGKDLTTGDIETTASYLGVFEDIWPMDEYMKTLRVPDNMLAKAA